MVTEIFKLEGSLDPVFGGGFTFASRARSVLGRTNFEGADSPEEDFSRNYGAKSCKFSVARLKNVWIPQPVEGDVNPFHDYPEMVPGIPIFSQRACDALHQYLTSNGELLPLKTKVGRYFIYNLCTVADVLDAKKSTIEFFPDSFKALSIDRYVFHESSLVGLSIFVIPENAHSVLVTKEFKDCVEKAGLNGFHFVKVYPFPKSVRWATEEAKRSRKTPSLATAKTGKKRVDAQTVVLFLPLDDGNKKPSAKEKKRLVRLQDEASAQLRLSTIESPYFGRVEGTDVNTGSVRMFFSCPDADALITKLEPWLKSLNWPKKIHIVKRLGEMYDPDVEEFEVLFSDKGRREKKVAGSCQQAVPNG